MRDIYALIQSAANSGAFGINGYAQPSLAQVNAGLYKKGRVKLHGLDIAIETPQGQRRIGKSDGKPWSVICMAHYGDLQNTKGADGDPIDVYVGPVPESNQVYVVNQTNKDGGFDEVKVLMAFLDEQSAMTAYLGSYERGWNRYESVVSASIDQFKWWLKFGDTTKPFTKNALPYEAEDDMSDIQWDSAAMPANSDLATILYGLRRHAESDLLLDAVSMSDVMEDAEGFDALDALVVESAKLGLKMEQLRRIMEATGDAVKPLSMQISEPFRQNGTTNITALFELSDGQTIAIFFHNPDSTPNKILPQDELVSWKWLLNKMDVTILVAPEKGRDLNPREVARRVMRLAEKNSARFAKSNSARAERMAAIEQSKVSVSEKEGTLAALDTEIADLQAKLGAKRENQAPQPGGEQGGNPVDQPEDSESVHLQTPGGLVIDVVKTKYRDGEWGVSYASTDIATAASKAEALEIAQRVIDADPSDISGMRAAADKSESQPEQEQPAEPTQAEPQEPESSAADEEAQLVEQAVEAARKGAGGITKLKTSQFFTFGDDILFSDELRAKVEAALGESLVEHVFSGLEGEIALVPASTVQVEQEPEPEPAPQPESATPEPTEPAVDDQAVEARALLQSIIDAEVDISDASIAERLEAIYEKYQEDADMMALFEQAASAYSDAVAKYAQGVLA